MYICACIQVYNKKRIVSSINHDRKIGEWHPIEWLDPYLTSYAKRNSKWFKNLNTRPEIIKPLEENIGCKFLNIGHDDDFLSLMTKAKWAKAKINKWNYLKLKIFCIAKKTFNRKKRQFTEWKRIFANHISNNNQYIKNSYKLIAN